jgi:hypothetical protein
MSPGNYFLLFTAFTKKERFIPSYGERNTVRR